MDRPRPSLIRLTLLRAVRTGSSPGGWFREQAHRQAVEDVGLAHEALIELEPAHDAHQTELRRRIIDDGRWMLNKAVVDGNVVLRPIVSNPALTEASLTELVQHIARMGDELASE